MEHQASRIVVGIDGSEGSKAALDWAVDEAVRRRAHLEIVSAWTVPPLVSLVEVGSTIKDGSWFEQVATDAIEPLVASIPADAVAAMDGMETEVVAGDSAATLIAHAKGADLLVVGTRGRGGFKGLVLGSVGLQCVLHAPCPVVVVPSVPQDA